MSSPTTSDRAGLADQLSAKEWQVTESGFEALPPDRRVEFMRRNEGGWAIQVENIKAHVGG